jgi:hypothetical protein
MAESTVLGYKLAAMRRVTLLAISAVALLSACSDATLPNGQLYFTTGPETSALDDLDHFTIERIDAKGKSKELYSDSSLPTTQDMGSSGTYRFRATGFDAAGNALARGETLSQDVATFLGGEAPIFLARTDRTSLADGSFVVPPGQYPKVGIVGSAALWLWADVAADRMTTDAYNFAFWQQVTPKTSSVDFTSFTCPQATCDWSTLVMVGGYYAITIGDDWAMLVDEYNGTAVDYSVPTALESFANIAGGRVLPGADYSAVVIGGARSGEPTAYAVGFDKTAHASILMLSTARAGAATLFEPAVGLVVVGGSSDGNGVERLEPNATAFATLNYPADAVTGAALVREDATHVLRVGGKNADGTPADTVRIDLACLDQCATEVLADHAVAVNAAQSFYDPESDDSIIVGEDETGQAIVYRYYSANGAFSPIAVPENQGRVHATPIELPMRQVALIGGTKPGNPNSSRSVIAVVSF